MAGPMNFLLELKPDKTGRFTLLADEIGLQGYASFTGLQLIIGKEQQNNTGSWTVSFTNKRLLMISQKVSSNEVTGLTLDRQFIREIKDCPGGLIKASKRVRLVIKGVNSPEEAFFELRFPEEDVTELKQSFLNVLKIVDLCLAYDSIEKFKELLKSNEALVNMVSNFDFSSSFNRLSFSPSIRKMNTLLIMACARNNSAVAMHLLQCEGIRSDTINKVTRTPVKRDGKMAEEVCGALYYACINGMEEVVEKLLSIPTADANILFSNEYTGLQYAILKDKECSTSNTNSKISYTKVISMLMSSRKTTWKIADDDEEHYSIPAEWILKTSYDTQRVILHCSRANELPVDLRQKLKASIQKMETKSTSFKSLNGEILRSNSSLTLISNITDDMESSSKICKSESTQSLSSKVNSSSVVNIDSIVEEINQCKSFFERLELPSTLQLAFVILKMLEIDEGITRARSLKLHKTTSQLSKQKKEWKTWKEQISVSIEKQLPLPLTGEGFEGIKIYLLAEIENLSQYHIDKGADEDVFEGLEQFKDQVEGLVLPSTGKQSTGKLEGTAGATSSAVVYPTFPLPPDKTSHVFI
eukprot:CAMPEP_0173155278 /NCGR_PEP_ID=MMETSP1105-20130129/14007_1 /TAXON_ID=2985 /ORGANISM="Ochromonas sp., Strain BG-1" /LENGTH=584 /DNA_ID=CAMNT_0014071667 /DNA_START=25 /DNA_END=1776 /DNA_ORIENTATION=-